MRVLFVVELFGALVGCTDLLRHSVRFLLSDFGGWEISGSGHWPIIRVHLVSAPANCWPLLLVIGRCSDPNKDF